MIKYCFLLFICFLSLQKTNANTMDPFHITQKESCDELISSLLLKLEKIQYQGHITVWGNNSKTKIILMSQSKTMTIHVGELLPVLSPWSIDFIKNKSIQWKAELPIFCGTTITYLMKFSL